MSKNIDELGDWRRSHTSIDFGPHLDGEEVTIMGWVASIRDQGGLTFLIIHDRDGLIQATIHRDRAPRRVLQRIDGLSEHSVVAIRGVVRAIGKAPHGAEVVPKEIRILNPASRRPPFSIFGGKLPSIDKRLDIRSLELRRPEVKAVFKIRHMVLQSLRDFFTERGYIEVNTPKIIATATEGGAALFPVLYYDKEAFLAQSPQLYKEQLTMAFEKVFEIGPVFRAEPSRTLRHLAEIVSVDLEEAYVSYIDVMKTLEEAIHHVMKTVSERCRGELQQLHVEPKPLDLPFKRYRYSEVVGILQDAGEKISWGEDLSTSALNRLGGMLPGFYFITDWPTASKPFYIKPRSDRPDVCEAFDLMYGSLEVASGGTRISFKKKLMKRLKEQGLKPNLFEYHLKLFEYGMPPHAGFGLGLDRFMMVITGEENIREVTLFPRDRLRLTP